MKKNSPQKWTWIFMVSLFVVGIIDIRFGILGFLCMLAPLYQVLRGKGKQHCRKYCPRGSFLGIFLEKISLNQSLPKWINHKRFKVGVLSWMMVAFAFSLYQAGLDFNNVAAAIFRLLLISSMISILFGVIFKPRSWCQVCPMGYGTGLIDKQMKKHHKVA